MEPRDPDKPRLTSWSYSINNYQFTPKLWAPTVPSVDEIIAQHDIYDKLLELTDTYPEAEEMLAAIGIK